MTKEQVSELVSAVNFIVNVAALAHVPKSEHVKVELAAKAVLDKLNALASKEDPASQAK